MGRICGHLAEAVQSGMARRGKTFSTPFSRRIVLSPPSAKVSTKTPSTEVRQPPTRIPCPTFTVLPPRTMETSVVVPPMSTTM